MNSPLGDMFSYTMGVKSPPKTAKVCRKYQDSIGTLCMSRPLAYKNTNLDAKPNLQEISASSDSWLRRIKQPAIGKTCLVYVLLLFPR